MKKSPSLVLCTTTGWAITSLLFLTISAYFFYVPTHKKIGLTPTPPGKVLIPSSEDSAAMSISLSNDLGIVLPSGYRSLPEKLVDVAAHSGRIRSWQLTANTKYEPTPWGDDYPVVDVTEQKLDQRTFCEYGCGGTYDAQKDTCAISANRRHKGVEHLAVVDGSASLEFCRREHLPWLEQATNYEKASDGEDNVTYRLIAVADLCRDKLYLVKWYIGFEGGLANEAISPMLQLDATPCLATQK